MPARATDPFWATRRKKRQVPRYRYTRFNQIKQLCLPFLAVEAARMRSLWIGLQGCTTSEHPTRKMLIQHGWAGVQSGPYCPGVRPRLTQSGLQGHRLMDALDLGVIGGSMHPCEADFHTQCK